MTTLRSFFALSFLALVLFAPCTCCNAFSLVSHHDGTRGRHLLMTRTFQSSSSTDIQDNDDNSSATTTAVSGTAVGIYDCTLPPELSAVERLKRQLLELGASFDRGFGASPRAREKVESIITELEQLNPEKQAARGIDGITTMSMDNDIDNDTTSTVQPVSAPLKGCWRMIWTTASDVLILSASPVFTVGAIHQVFDPLPVVTNVIDFSPRAQALLPPNLVPNTLLRAKVKTKASSRRRSNNGVGDDDILPNRVGLVFEAVQLQPLQVLGMNIDVFPQIGFDLPRLPDSLIPPGLLDGPDSPGYFDVVFLDYEVLIIRQNAPGGLFAFVKVDSIDA